MYIQVVLLIKYYSIILIFIMTEIQAVFKDDYQFLEQVAQRNKDWKMFQTRKVSQNSSNHNESLNFLSHPKRLNASQFDSDEEFERKTLIKTFKEKSLKPLHDNNNEKKTASVLEKSFGDCSSCENVLTAKSSKENISSKLLQPGIVKYNSVVDEDYFLSENNLPKKKIKSRPYIQPERVDNFDKKFRNLVERSLKILNKIKVMLENGIPSPDGEEDFHRRTRRSQEFSSRFSRIYLYPLLRQMNEIHNSEKSNSAAWINQKVLSIYQIIWQALQAYYNHLPSSIGKCCSDKLQNLLDQSLDVCQFQQDMNNVEETENEEFINAMRSHTELLLETLSTFDLKILEKKSNKRKNENVPATKRNLNPEMKLKSRFSMYSVTSSFRRDTDWKRNVDLATKKKFNVKSRYRTASFKHRPPVDKPNLIELKPKIAPQRSSGNVKQSPTIPEFREDDVQTMIELACPQVPANSALHLNHGSSKQLVRDFDQEDEYDEICKESELTPNNDDNKLLVIHELVKKTSKEKIISITGTKNAKLICIRDDSSLIESEDSSEKVKDKEIMTEKILNSSHTQTKLVNNKKCIKISRIRKTQMKSLEMLPKNNAINIIQYKLLYHNHQKNNPMYRKTINVQPWILMGRISDDILNGILQSVTKELEVNEILENLYNAEFQY